MLSLSERWAAGRVAYRASAVQNELVAMERLFAIAECACLEALALLDGDLLVGFIILENLHAHGWAVGHFQKTDPSYPETSSRLLHELGRQLHSRGLRIFNAEQDLGIPGLRYYKCSLQPRGFLKKYIIGERP